MAAPSEAYTYSPLPPGDVFRYLVLQPGQGNDPLKCNLYTSLLDTAPFFEAISYVWGDPERENPVICDGRIMKITANLQDVLRRVRLPTSTRALWADSICLNQNNLEEKAHQVSLMARIYTRADRTLMFIGLNDNGHAQKLVAYLDEVNDMIEDTYKTIEKTWNSFPWLEKDNFIFTDPRSASFKKLFRQEWFTRGWIVQESALAQDGRLIWGQYETTWEKLMRLTTVWIQRCPDGLSDMLVPLSHWDAYQLQNENELKVFWEDGSQPFGNFLDAFDNGRSLSLTNSHDRIYAFTDHPTDCAESRPKLNISYDRPYLETFMDFAQAYVRTNLNLDLLAYVIHSEESLAEDFPSWVPRWDLRPDEVGFSVMRSNWPPLRARDSSIQAPTLVGDANIRIRGVIFDSIIHTSQIFHIGEVTIDDVVDLWRQISGRDGSPYPPSHQLRAFVYALGYGKCSGDQKKWDRDEAAYMKYVSESHGDVSQIDNQLPGLTTKNESIDVVHDWVALCLDHKKFFVTKRGYFGFAPQTTREGDQCAILFGSGLPSILRKMEDTGAYKFIGNSFVPSKDPLVVEGQEYSVRFGDEGSEDWIEWDLEEEDIVLC